MANKGNRKFNNAMREAWGFHDAQLHAAMPGDVAEWRRGPRDTHFDRAYVRGYYAGMDAAKAPCSCPPAWCFATEASPQATCPR